MGEGVSDDGLRQWRCSARSWGTRGCRNVPRSNVFYFGGCAGIVENHRRPGHLANVSDGFSIRLLALAVASATQRPLRRHGQPRSRIDVSHGGSVNTNPDAGKTSMLKRASSAADRVRLAWCIQPRSDAHGQPQARRCSEIRDSGDLAAG